MRLTLTSDIDSRDGVSAKDERLTNMLSETDKDVTFTVVRPGLVLDAQASGVGHGLVVFNNELVSVYGATLGFGVDPSVEAVVVAFDSSGTKSVSGTMEDGFVERAHVTAALWECDLAYDGITFVTIGYPNIVAYSEDGVTWDNTTIGKSGNWKGLTWNGTIFCAVGYDGVNSMSATSSDGISWTTSGVVTSTIQLSDVAYISGLFCACGLFTDKCLTSPDGLVWTEQTLPSTANYYCIASNGSIFVLPKRGTTTVYYSSDGTSWSTGTLPSADAWEDIAWNGTKFCAISSGTTTVITSSDGITWAAKTVTSRFRFSIYASTDNYFYIASGGAGFIERSTDNGETWTASSMPFTMSAKGVAARAASVASIPALATITGDHYDFAQSPL